MAEWLELIFRRIVIRGRVEDQYTRLLRLQRPENGRKMYRGIGPERYISQMGFLGV